MTTLLTTTNWVGARSRHGTRTAVRCAVAALLGICVWLGAPGNARADTPAPAWAIHSLSFPTNFNPGDVSSNAGHPEDLYQIQAINVGGAQTSGTVTITDYLPAGLTVDNGLGGVWGDDDHENFSAGDPYNGGGAVSFFQCSGSGQIASCTYANTLAPGGYIEMFVPVDVAPTLSGSVTNVYSVAGGAPDLQGSSQTTISSTQPSFGLVPGQGGLSESITNADGTTDTQAGSTPYQFSIDLTPNTSRNLSDPSSTQNTDVPKDLTVNLPAGLVVNPTAVPQCTDAELTQAGTTSTGCPDDTAVGTIGIAADFGDDVGPTYYNLHALYNMVPPPGSPAAFAFSAYGQNIYLHLLGSLRTGTDYGLSANLSDLTAQYSIVGIETTLWGDPTAPAHDDERGVCAPGDSDAPPSGLCPVARSSVPFLRLPSACSGPLTTTVSMDQWENPGVFQDYSTPETDSSGNPVSITGCSQLAFNPSISVQPTVTTADSPTGLNVDLSVPQNDDSSELATANLEDATVTLPAGVSINPSSADGLQACTPAEIGINNASEPSCPDASKIGSVEVDTPLLSTPMMGGVYIAQQNNNPFNSLFAIYVTAEADGALIKLAGQVTPNPITGQLQTTFDDNPQLPFSDFKLDFFNGPRAVLATPAQCGTYSTSGSLSPWSGTLAVTPSDSFAVNSGCATGFKPSFVAGTTSNTAGGYSPFELSFARSDSDQDFSGLSVTLPDGLVAKLAGVPECSEQELASISTQPGTGAAQAANPSCPAASQVGTVETWAGAGSDPFSLPGKVYLTGPYKGAPYGLAVVVPAVAGPYDLGTVLVRQALDVNPTTAQVTTVSDPLPTIIQGVPLRVRQITVNLQRPQFTLNPTSCDPSSIAGTLTSIQDASADVSSRFQAARCSSLGFSPKLKIALTGKGQTRSDDHPTLTATLTQPAGQANIATTKVALPLSMALDPNNSQHVCNYNVAKAVTTGPANCPASTLVGHATADTPLLSQPLTGPVYLVQGIRYSHGNEIRTLPTLLITLRGQIALDLRAQTSVNGKEQLVTTFPTIPDAAVSKFVLTITGGKRGILVITGRGRTICDKPQVANANIGAQSGKTQTPNITLTTPCKKN